jgi:hypothetical protein
LRVDLVTNAKRDTGAWLVAVYKVLSQYSTDEPALDPLEAIIKAGRAAELFSAVRAAGPVSGERFEMHRKLARLRPSDAKQVIEIAVDQGYISVEWISTTPPAIKTLEFLVNSNDSVLEAAGGIFERLDPTPTAAAVLQILKTTLALPKTREAVQNEFGTVSEKVVKDALQLATALQLVRITDGTEGGSPLVFNPYVFEGGTVDALRMLNSLSAADRQHAQDIVNHVYGSPGVPLPATTNKRILQLLVQVGVIDFSKITTTNSNKGVYFPTAPNAWGVLAKTSGPELSQDLIDDSKLFINSLRYGEFYSSSNRGKIISPYLIVNALLRDGAIGAQKPATAIGEDYPLAWSRGIINVVESRIYPGRYSMELLKRDVASAVKDVLSTQKILPTPNTPSADDIERAGRFVSPGAVRVEKELPPELKQCHDELVFGLRIMKRRR